MVTIKRYFTVTFICFFVYVSINGQSKESDKNVNLIHIEKSNYGLIFTDIHINGKRVKAMIDFGDPNVLQLSSEFVVEEGLEVKKTNAIAKDVFGNTFEINIGVVKNVIIGKWKDVDVKFFSSPNEMESVAKQINTKFEAVVGWGYFSQYYTEINYKGNTFSLYKDKPKKRNALFSTKYSKTSNYLSVPVVIEEKNVNLIIDTGSPVTVIDSSFYSESKREMLSFKLGQKQISLNPHIQDLTMLKQLDAVGILGGDFLGKYKVLIDPFGNKLIFI